MARNDDEVTIVRQMNPLLSSREKDEVAYVVVLSGVAVGQMVRAVRGIIRVGRHPENDLVVDDDGVSRRHAQIVTPRRGPTTISDLGSTNGTYVEGKAVDGNVELADGDRIRVGPATILKYGYRDTVEHQFLNRLYQSATRDGLTGLFKREYFEEQLRSELAWHKRHSDPLSLLMLDVDHFKRVNDTFGHQVGDEVLRRVAVLIKHGCRTEDLVARYGGEEFVVVLRSTDTEEAQQIATRVCASVREQNFGVAGNVTISVGVCTRRGESLESGRELVAGADRLLYEAKHQGRDRVVADDLR
jgi:diguanylate cyclase (GGDEF)-like protein